MPAIGQGIANRIGCEDAPGDGVRVHWVAPAAKAKDLQRMGEPRRKEQRAAGPPHGPQTKEAPITAPQRPANGKERMGQRCEKAVVVQIDGQRNCQNIAAQVEQGLRAVTSEQPPEEPGGEQATGQQPAIGARLLGIPDLKSIGCQQQRRHQPHLSVAPIHAQPVDQRDTEYTRPKR